MSYKLSWRYKVNKLNNLSKLIGNTPLIRITYRYNNYIRNSYFKCEWYNLTGSIKDRVAYSIIKSSYDNGTLGPSQTIVETTSGNMGISFCAIGRYLGHRVVIFMPKSMSRERKEIIKLYGGELYECDTFEECFFESQKYAVSHSAFLGNQFENIYNIQAHYSTTAIEILEKIPHPKCFVAGVGTSGTLMGVGKKFKEICNSKIIAIEPKSSLILSSGVSQGAHKLQGLSDDIIPMIYDKNIVDDIISISDNDAIAMAQKLSTLLGLGVGISSGANFVGSVLSNIDDTISVFTDDNKKYLSTDLITPTKSALVDSIDLLQYEVI